MPVLVASSITVGEHYTTKVGGLTLNLDTIWSTAVAGAIVVGMGLWLRSRATAGIPGRMQLFWETVVGSIERQVETFIGPVGRQAVPLAVALFMVILFSNWLGILPSGARRDTLPAPTADVNLTYALALIVIVVVVAAAIRTRGLRAYLHGFAKPYKALIPINVIEEVAKPFTLALRLFGNIFAGALMVVLLSLLTPYVLWAPTVLWKVFDMAIGLIQAFIFALLTLIYYQFAVTGH